jgi:hypothetical protein
MHNEELHDLYSLIDIVKTMKINTIRWAGHTARIGDEKFL